MTVVPRLSIGTRILILCAIPIVGLCIVGAMSLLGTARVDLAFEQVNRSMDAVAQASRLQLSFSEMRRLEREIRLRPEEGFIQAFDGIAGTAKANVSELAQSKATEGLDQLSRGLDEVVAAFGQAMAARVKLGVKEKPGLEQAMTAAATAFDDAIDSITVLGAGDGGVPDLRRMFSAMRDAERSIAIVRTNAPLKDVDKGKGDIEFQLKGMAIAPKERAGLNKLAADYAAAVHAYADMLITYDQASDQFEQAIAAIAPKLADVSTALRQLGASAETDLTATESRIAWLQGMTLGIVILAAIGLGWRTGRSIIGPLRALAGSLIALTRRSYGEPIPGTARSDELGEMARCIDALKASMIEGDRLASEEAAGQEARQRRADALDRLLREFDDRIGRAVETVTSESRELQGTAKALAGASAVTIQVSGRVLDSCTQAAGNVRSVAAAAEQLGGTIAEVDSRVRGSTELVEKAVEQAQATDTQVNLLNSAAAEIDEVVKLISAIAGQTNLLALNATIEAARAGEAGKGFAVVASEVKQLATQTTHATKEITERIEAIRLGTMRSIEAISVISSTISDVDRITRDVRSSMNEQSAATHDISSEAAEASRSTEAMTQEMRQVADAAAQGGSAAERVLETADRLSGHGANMKAEIDRFLAAVRTA